MSAPSSHVDVVQDFWRFFSRHPEGGDIMKYAYLSSGDRFGAVTQVPEYYVTEDELRTLDEQTAWLASTVMNQRRCPGARSPTVAPTRVVEWGPGPGHIVQRKTAPLLKALAGGPYPLIYEAVDISAAYVREAADVVTNGLAGAGVSAVVVQETVADFMAHAAAQTSDDGNEQSTCMLFWGVTFGNFGPTERERLIAGIKSYDTACFTVDHNLDLSSLALAYDHAQNHSFLRGPLEYFQSAVREDPSVEVSGFDLSAWEAGICFETEHRDSSGAVDELVVSGYVCSRRDQTLIFTGPGLDRKVVHVAAGERFQVCQSRKYSEGRTRELIDGVPSKQPKRVVASGLFGADSRVGLVVVSGDTSSSPRVDSLKPEKEEVDVDAVTQSDKHLDDVVLAAVHAEHYARMVALGA